MSDKPLNMLQEKFPELAQWIQSICPYSNLGEYIIGDYKDEMIHLTFYTKYYSYHISASKEKESDYLGCIAQTRKLRAGEDWPRGNDLPDGDYSEETWSKIVKGIVKYEMVKVVNSQRNLVGED